MHCALLPRISNSALCFLLALVPACVPDASDDAGPDVMDAGPHIATCSATPAAAGNCNDASVCVQGSRTSVGCSSAIQNFAASAGANGTGFFVVSTRFEGSSSTYNTHLLTIPADGGATSFDQPTVDIDGGYYGFSLHVAPEAWDLPAVFWQPDPLGPVYVALVSDATPRAAGEVAIPAVDGGSTGIAAGAMAPSGTLYAWGYSGAGRALATRVAGTWSVASVPGSTEFPSGIAVGPDGQAYTAQWSPGTTTGSTGRLTLSVRGGAPTDVLSEQFTNYAVITRIAVGHSATGAAEPVILWDNQGLFAAVPSGAGAYTRLEIPQPGVTDECPHGAVHFTCDDCHAPVCSTYGDAIYAADLATASDGSVWVAYLMVHYDSSQNVNAVPQTVGGQTVGCDCQLTPTRDDTHATEVVLARVQTGAGAAVQVRAHVPAPPDARSVSLSQRDGVFHVVMGEYGASSGPGAMHVAIPAAALP